MKTIFDSILIRFYLKVVIKICNSRFLLFLLANVCFQMKEKNFVAVLRLAEKIKIEVEKIGEYKNDKK